MEIINDFKGNDAGHFVYGGMPVPVGCYSILLTRLRGEHPGRDSRFVKARQQFSQNLDRAPRHALLLSSLAVVDALLNDKETSISEGKRAVEMLPTSADAIDGPGLMANLAVVYAWNNELELALDTLNSIAKMPNGIYYGELKLDPYWDPLRKDPRFEKLLAELAPRD